MKNNNTQIDRKIFIVGKVYDLLVTDKDTVGASVQKYWDNVIGKDRVRFEPYIIGSAVVTSFYRGFDYSSYNADLTKDIMDVDAPMMTAYEHESFMMPVPFPTLSAPGLGYPYHISRTGFLDVYRKSVKVLGASRIKNASLDISPVSVILRVQIG